MAVPSSGELELYGDIGTELGVAQSNVTLHGMSQTAGFSAPDAMSEFYGYSPTSGSFNTVLYTGDGNDNRAITGVGFEPDFIWLKNRTSNWGHTLVDRVRGLSVASVYGALSSDQTAAEKTDNSFGAIKTLDVDGFTIKDGTDIAGYYAVNRLNNDYVAWCWKAGGAAVTNTDGTITSQVSANTEAGFSIVSYTGVGSGSNRTVGHGLNQAPEIIIVKNRDGTQGWLVWTTLIDGSSDYLFLNSSGPKDNSGQSLPTSTVFNIQNDGGGESNANGNKYIGYCFHSVTGVSKFGTYTGNGSTNGPTITTGFEPAFVMIKRVDATAPWFMFDNKRNPTNNRNRFLLANSSGAEAVGNPTTDYVAFNSDNFKITSDPPSLNGSGGTYIYMAFA